MSYIQLKKGFNLVEIILALAIATLVFIAVFNFITTVYIRIHIPTIPNTYFSYMYGEQYCMLSNTVKDIQWQNQSIPFASYISTSTQVTSVHVLDDNAFLVTTNSASTSENDIFVFTIATTSGVVLLTNFIDVGPGIQDSKLLDNFLYIANTSTYSHVKSFHIDRHATGSAMFVELSNIRIPFLSAGISNPKKLSIYNHNLILGSEKNNSGPEVYVMPIESDGAVHTTTHMFELNGQLNQSFSSYEQVYLANAADPELRHINTFWQELLSYDAPLTLGNGKSVLYLHPYTILGRTIGSSELSLLNMHSTTTDVLDTKRTNGTVDYLQELHSQIVSTQEFLSITANETKELQFWHIENTQLVLDKTIDIPGRVTAYTCDAHTLYAFITSNNQTTLIWLNL